MAFGLGSSRVIFTLVYLIVRSVLGLLVVLFRRGLSKDAELLVLRHENAVPRRHIGRVRYEPADRAWLAALARLVPRRRWSVVFPVTPATLLAWHRKLAAKKYDTSKRRKPGRPPTIRSIAHLAVRLARECLSSFPSTEELREVCYQVKAPARLPKPAHHRGLAFLTRGHETRKSGGGMFLRRSSCRCAPGTLHQELKELKSPTSGMAAACSWPTDAMMLLCTF
jgi:hypothetical protein